MCGVSTINTDKNKMKKIILLLSAAAFIMLISCSKEKEKDEPTLDNKVLINEIFKAGMSWLLAGNGFKINSSDQLQCGILPVWGLKAGLSMCLEV